MTRPRPSYSQGFARSASECAYPHLWDGLVGAWCPNLGPSGMTLFDHSGFGRHGTIVGSNFNPATDWQIQDGGYTNGYCLNGDGDQTNGMAVDVSGPSGWSPGAGGWHLTISMWVRFTSFGPTDERLFSKATSTSSVDHWIMLGVVNSGGQKLRARVKGNVDILTLIGTGETLVAGKWYFAVLRVRTTDGDVLRAHLMLGNATTGVFDSEHATGTVIGPMQVDDTVDVNIGRNPHATTPSKQIDGRLDDVRVYHREQLNDELREVFRLGRGQGLYDLRLPPVVLKAPVVTIGETYLAAHVARRTINPILVR